MKKMFENINVFDDISAARRIIEKRTTKLDKVRNVKFGTFCPIYTFSNENITKTYTLGDFKNKDVLTVCSSGDHSLSATLYGAKKVDTFDINRLTKYYANLKKAAIIGLDYDKFYDFLACCELREEIYNQIRILMDKDSRIFWDSLFDLYAKNRMLHIENLLIKVPASYNDNEIPFLNKEKFEKLKRKLTKTIFEFIESDLLEIKSNIKKTYDIIHLSNILDYIGLSSYENFVMENIDPILNPGGIAYIKFLFACDEFTSFNEQKNNEAGKLLTKQIKIAKKPDNQGVIL